MSAVKRLASQFWHDEDGLGTLEILLIIAVLVAVAIVFREWIIKWINDLFTSTNERIDKNHINPISPGDSNGNTSP